MIIKQKHTLLLKIPHLTSGETSDNLKHTSFRAGFLRAVGVIHNRLLANRIIELSARCAAGRFFAVLIMISIILPCISAADVHASIAENATVTATEANIRKDHGTTSQIAIRVNSGQRAFVGDLVTITGDPSGYNSWYAVSVIVGGIQYDGYIVSTFVQKDPTGLDPAFETAISGFPESYKQSLRSLHQAHPSWIFNPVNIGTDWNTVVAAESTLGISLIPDLVDDAWKSKEPGAYDWTTNTYIVFDGSSWVNASKGVVAYYLDPRNFTNESNVFQFLNLSYDAATQTQDAVQTLLNGSFMASNQIADATGAPISYAQAFIQAGAASGSSPFQLVSRVIQEVSMAGSRSTSGTEPGYEGYFNYYNIGASSAADPVILGLTYAMCGSSNISTPMAPETQAVYMIPWNSPYRSIVGGAIYISSNYILKGQNTLYLQKFDVTDGGNGFYKHQYMTNIQAMTGESLTLYNAYSKSGLLSLPLTFNIPVYTGMPDTPADLPAKTGSTAIRNFVTRFYELCLNRTPDEGGLTYWTSGLQAGIYTAADSAKYFVFSPEFLNRNVSNDEYITIMYKAFFNRDPDSGGKAYWISLMDSGMSRYYILSNFVNSQEFANLSSLSGISPGNLALSSPADLYPQITAFVTRFYKICLNRMPDTDGLNHWVEQLQIRNLAGANVARDIVTSPEFVNRGTSSDDYVEILYQAFFNRASEPSGKAYWVARLNAGTTRYSVLVGFVNSQEFTNVCNTYGINRGMLS